MLARFETVFNTIYDLDNGGLKIEKFLLMKYFELLLFFGPQLVYPVSSWAIKLILWLFEMSLDLT